MFIDKPITIKFPKPDFKQSKSVHSGGKSGLDLYRVHYIFLLRILQVIERIKWTKVRIEFYDMDITTSRCFKIYLNNLPIIIDFTDGPETRELAKVRTGQKDIYFKYHYGMGVDYLIYDNLFPIGPISFYDWTEYGFMEYICRYSAKSDVILSNQRFYGPAKKLRSEVQSKLFQKYGEKNTNFSYKYSRKEFWLLMNDCLVSVCVPGRRIDILDRGQFQYMGLGCCTISPRLVTTLSFNKVPVSGIHYIECKTDFSDVEDKIEYCRKNRDMCVDIGGNAKRLFLETSTPMKIWEWMLDCLWKIQI